MEINEILTNEVASPPVVYHKLKDAIRDPESTFQDFADIIRSDSGLSSRLLRIVNSSFYGLSTSVDSVVHALATVVMSKFHGIPKVTSPS